MTNEFSCYNNEYVLSLFVSKKLLKYCHSLGLLSFPSGCLAWFVFVHSYRPYMLLWTRRFPGHMESIEDVDPCMTFTIGWPWSLVDLYYWMILTPAWSLLLDDFDTWMTLLLDDFDTWKTFTIGLIWPLDDLYFWMTWWPLLLDDFDTWLTFTIGWLWHLVDLYYRMTLAHGWPLLLDDLYSGRPWPDSVKQSWILVWTLQLIVANPKFSSFSYYTAETKIYLSLWCVRLEMKLNFHCSSFLLKCVPMTVVESYLNRGSDYGILFQ